MRSEGGRRRPAAGTILGLLALVVAVAGGSAYATVKLSPNSVKQRHIAKNQVTNKHTKHLQVAQVRRVAAAIGANETTAPDVVLAKRGPFRLVARCWASSEGANGTNAMAYVTTTQPKALAFGTVSDLDGYPSFLEPTTATAARRLWSAANAPQSTAEVRAGAVTAIRGKVAFGASVTAMIKGGTLPEGNGAYGGGGKRCVFHSIELGAS